MYFCLKLPSASSWGCELKSRNVWNRNTEIRSASSWGCELKWISRPIHSMITLSASSWGCELKYQCLRLFPVGVCQPLREAVSWNVPQISIVIYGVSVSLFVRLWVEIEGLHCGRFRIYGQPLREAVSWNNGLSATGVNQVSQPLREAVSWNNIGSANINTLNRQPLREAVSWNIFTLYFLQYGRTSASSWGCELKYQ